MRQLISALALVAIGAMTAGAQQPGHAHQPMMADSVHRMKTPCPLHLETLSLTTQQKASMDSLRTAHATVMQSVMKSHESHAAHEAMKPSAADSAMMESNMRLTVAAMRSILTDAQRVTFDEAVTAHAAEMAAMKAKGGGMACCVDCMKHHAQHPAAAKHQE